MNTLESIKSKIRTIPDFPKKGIMFRDITTLLRDAQGLHDVIEQFYLRYKDKKLKYVVGIESRGFIIGGALAERLGIGFIPVRKKGKLPGEKVQLSYDLEYGSDTIEIHKDAFQKGDRILILDDLIATGGTAAAACRLVESLGAVIVEAAFIVELPALRGREKLSKYPIYCMVEFEGD